MGEAAERRSSSKALKSGSENLIAWTALQANLTMRCMCEGGVLKADVGFYFST